MPIDVAGARRNEYGASEGQPTLTPKTREGWGNQIYLGSMAMGRDGQPSQMQTSEIPIRRTSRRMGQSITLSRQHLNPSLYSDSVAGGPGSWSRWQGHVKRVPRPCVFCKGGHSGRLQQVVFRSDRP
jgi:hypothetical protein